MTTYGEKLRDPRWQRKRLELMAEAGFACVECDAADKTLHVHHGYYRPGADPWDYEIESLHVLCEDCHRLAEYLLSRIRKRIGVLQLIELSELEEWIRQATSSIGIIRASQEFRRSAE